jgi:hypothetical protein
VQAKRTVLFTYHGKPQAGQRFCLHDRPKTTCRLRDGVNTPRAAMLPCIQLPFVLLAPTSSGTMRCFNTTHIVMPDNMHVACGVGFSCAPLPIPCCISEQSVAGHAPKAAGYEIIASMPALQLGLCTENATDDASKGKNLCEAWHATKMMKPTFGIHFSSTWGRVSNVSDAPCDPNLEPTGSNNICRGCKTGLEYRQCWSKNLKNLSSAMISQSPKLMLQCDLAEIIYCDDHA